MKYLNPNDIESINSIKRTRLKQQLLFRTDTIRSKIINTFFLTLEQIKSEYTKVKKNVIYMVNGEFIKENIDTSN
jgi:hypothetical protein